MAFLISDRNSKSDHGSRVATPYKNSCATMGSLYISPKKQIIHGMRTTEKVKCWNSQKVRKVKASTANTNQDKNKNRLGVRKSL